jgi:hypothetical protein
LRHSTASERSTPGREVQHQVDAGQQHEDDRHASISGEFQCPKLAS